MWLSVCGYCSVLQLNRKRPFDHNPQVHPCNWSVEVFCQSVCCTANTDSSQMSSKFPVLKNSLKNIRAFTQCCYVTNPSEKAVRVWLTAARVHPWDLEHWKETQQSSHKSFFGASKRRRVTKRRELSLTLPSALLYTCCGDTQVKKGLVGCENRQFISRKSASSFAFRKRGFNFFSL